MQNSKEKKLPKSCPSCGNKLVVQKLHCEQCQTEVSGIFNFPFLAQLNEVEQQFILEFVKNSGSLKTMAKYMNRSYPSVRNYLDDLIEKIQNLENDDTNNN